MSKPVYYSFYDLSSIDPFKLEKPITCTDKMQINRIGYKYNMV
jgi:hypothetical protein